MAVTLRTFPARHRRSNLGIAFVALLGLFLLPSIASAQGSPAPPSAAAGGRDGIVSIGGQVVMRLRSTAGGMSTIARVDAIEDRLTKIVAVPDITPSNVVVYAPAGKPPVIYVLGSRLITVDAATVKAAGGGTSRQLAVLWAKRLQQILPKVNIRLPNEPEPVVPANPPLLVTNSLLNVGGNVGDVIFRGKPVMRLLGIAPNGLTAVERADMLHDRLNLLAKGLNTSSPNAVSVAVSKSAAKKQPQARTVAHSVRAKGSPKAATRLAQAAVSPPATILMGGKPVYTVTPADAMAAGSATPASLAQSWAKNIRLALGIPANGAAPPASPPTPSASNATAPAAAPPPPPPPLSAPPPPPAPGTPANAPAANPPAVNPPAVNPPAPSTPAPTSPSGPPPSPSTPVTPSGPPPAPGAPAQ